MSKVINHGSIYSKFYRMRCKWCSCEFVAVQKDFTKCNSASIIDCPECKETIWVDFNENFKLLHECYEDGTLKLGPRLNW